MILGESQKDPKVAAKTKEYLDYSRTKKTVANVLMHKIRFKLIH